MSFIIIECEQGTQEWLDARCGVITASLAPDIMKVVNGLDARQKRFVDEIKRSGNLNAALEVSGYKKEPTAEVVRRALDGEKVGDFSDAVKAEAFRIACEREGGQLLDFDGFENWQMKRGNELEPAARAEHALRIGEKIERAGFIHTDDRLFGCSADGTILDKAGAEYKCFISPTKLRSMILDDDFADTLQQVHMGLWLTGFEFWDFALYCPALEAVDRHFIRWRVYRDDDYLAEEMEPRLVEFNELVESYRVALTKSSKDRVIGFADAEHLF